MSSPRYFLVRLVYVTSTRELNSLFLAPRTFGLKKTANFFFLINKTTNFLKFTFCPEALSYICKYCLIQVHSSGHALKKR